MARSRGLAAEDRLALKIACVTADASLVLGPALVYQIIATLLDCTTTGHVSIADSSASGDADKETSKIEVQLGSGEASANGLTTVVITPPKPIGFSQTVVADITNSRISVAYVPWQ